jgi:hypothetical protein
MPNLECNGPPVKISVISDRDRFPVWREWAAEAGQVPSRAIAVERLKLLGVLKDSENDWSG